MVIDVRTKRVYRAKELRYDSQMTISNPTSKHDRQTVVAASYCPSRRKGHRVAVWYYPDRPRDIRRPRAEGCLYGLLVLSGLTCVFLAATVKNVSETNLTNNPKPTDF